MAEADTLMSIEVFEENGKFFFEYLGKAPVGPFDTEDEAVDAVTSMFQTALENAIAEKLNGEVIHD